MGVFFGTAAFALILARGNTFTDQGISATGTIRLNSPTDDGVSVYLDEQIQRLTSNKTIENVLPGKYLLRVQKEQYSSWEQEIEISAGLVTDVDFRLFPDELQLTSLETKNISQLFFSKDRSRMYYVVADSQIGANIGIWQRDLNTSNFGFNQGSSEVKLTNLVGSISTSAKDKTLLILPSPDNRKILINSGTGYYVLDTDTYNEPTSINKLSIDYPIDQIKWLRDSNNLLILSDKILIDHDIIANTSTIVSYNGIDDPVFSIANGIAYFIENDTLMVYSSGISTEVKLLNVTLPKDITEIIAPKNSLQNLALKSGESLYFLNIEQSFITEIGEYEVVAISPSGENIFIRNSEGISSVDITVSQLRDSVKVDIQNSELPMDVINTSIQWSNNNSYIVYSSQSSESVYTADQFGNNTTTVLEPADTKVIVYGITPDNSALLTLLQDLEKANIYRLDFEPSN